MNHTFIIHCKILTQIFAPKLYFSEQKTLPFQNEIDTFIKKMFPKRILSLRRIIKQNEILEQVILCWSEIHF